MQILARHDSDFMSNTEVWVVRSDNVGDRFRICVTGPENPVQGTKYGAVYALDGNFVAGACASATRLMSLARDVPPLFSIAIGYPLDHPIPHVTQRNRDLTPSPLPSADDLMPGIFGGPIVPSGGGAAFLRFILEELRPAMTNAYDLDQGETLLAGMSLGGLFTLYALATDPTSFRRYLAISPAVWWDDRLVPRLAEALSPDRRSDGSVYLCAGELESAAHVKAALEKTAVGAYDKLPDYMRRIDMITDLQAMAGILRARTNFKVSHAVMASETHQSILGPALSQGLRRLYGTL
jgi:predicted alpha/beta superfamily hydrolase